MNNILIIHYEGNCSRNPSLYSLIKSFLSYNYHVTYLCSASFPSDACFANDKSFTSVRIPHYVLRLRIFLSYYPWSRFLDYVFTYYLFLSLPSFTHIISVDREGLIDGSLLANYSSKDNYYFSFEIMFGSETGKYFKTIERLSSSSISRSFAQDQVRKQILSLENNIPTDKIDIIPLALSSRYTSYDCDFNIQQYIQLDPKCSYAIHIGSLSPWSGLGLFLKNTAELPPNWKIVIHTFSEYIPSDLQSVLDNSSIKQHIIVLKTPSLPFPAFKKFLSYFTCGLGFYFPTYESPYTGKNLEYIGAASGKISLYLSAGLPIITNDIGYYSSMAELHNFGITLTDFTEFKSCLNSLSSKMGDNSRSFFLDNLDFDIFEPLLLTLFS